MTNPPSLLLAIALLVLLFSKPSLTVFVSIDCGSSESVTDENNIRWTGDDAYIQHGESIQVYSGSNPLSTLRVFPTRKKNCYSIRVKKGEKVLTRASFYYGNYDNKLSPPIFDLQFDGNYWATVNTSSSYDYVDYEAIYVTKGNLTSICVAQTKPNQLPFISSLEVRSLDTTMYSHVDSNHALFLQWRYALGGNQTIRYPDDAFDRIWLPAFGIALSEVKSEASRVDISTAEDHPPQAALQNAIISSSTNEFMQFINRLPNEELPIYITTYFSEVMESAVGKRSIQMYIDNKTFSSPIVPPFGSVEEVYITNMTASADTSFVLEATDSSTLPPILNALEVYTLSDALTAGTDSRDVEGLLQLKLAFEVLVDWSGDPCLPYPYNWDWIQCTTDVTPRVIALYLSGYELQGILPDFSSMNALETIDLHNNTIEGPILDFLGHLPNLKTLNLSDNRFNGSIPASLNNKNIKIE
ncbi:probable LRR receptor-like serine/threonine-protein kinase At5g59680 [Gastrolobium bilobum]|uniref:probable LRR receptor-like serine/threonine-protein kinase At5g59680 n=1 Tax=Gastrolobium bilobum TaxID=150636 RepID=UPI002AB28AC8|nr:probable LRR receptor-like serine/threonine-protein kinase At5g59680 [Gastrolobium bilobum]